MGKETEKRPERREVTIAGTVERAAGEKTVIRGRAIVFGQPTVLYEGEGYEVREVVDRDAVTKELLDRSDIKMTLYHDPTRILARSNKGQGTLSYSVGDEGVDFEFEPADNADGRTLLTLVERGDLSGCSFRAWQDYDEYERSRTVTREGDRRVITYTIRNITRVLDFTVTGDPQYEQTSVEAFARSAVEADMDAVRSEAAATVAAGKRRKTLESLGLAGKED